MYSNKKILKHSFLTKWSHSTPNIDFLGILDHSSVKAKDWSGYDIKKTLQNIFEDYQEKKTDRKVVNSEF